MLHSALIEHVNAGAHDMVIGLTLTWGARVRDHAALHPGHRSFRCSLICTAASVFLDAWVRSGCPEAVGRAVVDAAQIANDKNRIVTVLNNANQDGKHPSQKPQFRIRQSGQMG